MMVAQATRQPDTFIWCPRCGCCTITGDGVCYGACEQNGHTKEMLCERCDGRGRIWVRDDTCTCRCPACVDCTGNKRRVLCPDCSGPGFIKPTEIVS